ncbi:MAG: squalene/phytoene synthase family protein [Rickettsiales bacterium]|nr:squalene/phytoene synthase family protein [Rickettsiales bacterium]
MSESKRSNFYWPMQCMAKPRRDAMMALYAFCRAVDDIADGESVTKLETLQQWQDWIDSIYEGRAVTELVPNLAKAIAEYDLDKVYFLGIIEGMRMDANGPVVMPDYETLQRYCYCVAGCVGQLTVQILGCRDESHRRLATELGHALQLTNILRDVEADARMGRVYLAKPWFEEVKLEALDAAAIVQDPSCVADVCAIGAMHAQLHYDKANHIIKQSSQSALLPALLMRDVYFRLFTKMRKDKWRRATRYELSGMDAFLQLCKAPRYLVA